MSISLLLPLSLSFLPTRVAASFSGSSANPIPPIKIAQNPTVAFDYYEELQVAPTASLRELTATYHRLARLHHPDRSPRNEEQATSSFQRLQQAYETLSDAAKRAHYDKLHPRPPAVPSSSPPTSHKNKRFTTSDDDGLGVGDDDERKKRIRKNDDESKGAGESFNDELSENEFSAGDFGFSRHFPNVPPIRSATAGSSRAPPSQHTESLRPQQQGFNDNYVAAFNRDVLKSKKWRNKLAARFEVEYRQQNEEKAPCPPQFIKKRAEFAAIQTMIALLMQEQEAQEQLWRDCMANATAAVGTTTTTTSKNEKKKNKHHQASCLHSYLCTKLQKADNFKCVACEGADSMWVYQCPYCNSVLCVSCCDKFMMCRTIEDMSRQVLVGH